MKRLKYLPLLLTGGIAVLLFQNCGKSTSLQFSSSLNLSDKQAISNSAVALLNTKCAACHNPQNMGGNIRDITDLQYLIYSRLIVPGEPELSPIIMQTSQGLMPPTGTLSNAEVAMLKQWVKNMDPNNLGTGGTPVAVVYLPKYSDLSAKIFTPYCVTCHAGRNYKLNSYDELKRVVNIGDGANSLLYLAITVGRTGGRMPQGGALGSDQIAAIKAWIDAGLDPN